MKRYSLKSVPEASLAELSAYSPLVAGLLSTRGIKSTEAAHAFLNPDYDRHIHDPYRMKGMDRAVERIRLAVSGGERIVIYSDYDADGVPGGVLLADVFKKIGYTNVRNYIPHRHDEGFGLNTDAVDDFVADGTKLIITVDCGIADTHEIMHAKKAGIDTIVTDHHLPPSDGIPDAYAVLDPKQADCEYPYKELSGTGVAFKLAQALYRVPEWNIPPGQEKWLLDLVGIATLSDMVPLTGENRVLSRFGLLVLRKSVRPGLSALFRRERIKTTVLSEEDVVFSLTPKINAASRLGSADIAFTLLSTRDPVQAESAADELLRLNNERKGIVGSLVREVHKRIQETEECPVIVAGNPSWRPSLLGLVANSLVKDHGKPVFLWGRDGDGRLKGSCRSDGRTNVFLLMESAAEAFLEFGGHAFSGGFSLKLEKTHELSTILSRAYDSLPKSETSTDLLLDAELRPEEVTRALFSALHELSPFGEGNPRPLFYFRDVEVESVRGFGKTKDHTEFLLRRSGGTPLRAIQFFKKPDVYEGKKNVTLVASLEQSNFGRIPELRLRVVDAF